jgi:hypothetical protein
VLAGLDTNVLIDIRVLRAEPVLARVLAGEGWTTAFVDQEFTDPLEEAERGVGRLFPFIEVDPVDGRLLSRIERDQIAIAGQQKATAGSAAGEASLIHAALASRPGSIVLSNDPLTRSDWGGDAGFPYEGPSTSFTVPSRLIFSTPKKPGAIMVFRSTWSGGLPF